MKKICILSYWDSLVNYGQILQGAALQKVLKDIGTSPITIRYNFDFNSQNTQEDIRKKIHRVFTDDTSLYKHFYRYISNKLSTKKIRNSNGRKFEDFKKKYLNLSSLKYNTIDDFINNYIDAYCYIVGSDQVWHEYGTLERKEILLLKFVKPNTKKIAYAASFGRNEIKDKVERDIFKLLLPQFNRITVRESSGVKLCKELGIRHVSVMPDPTILLSKQEWELFLNIQRNRNENKTVFVYMLSQHNKTLLKYINFFKKKGYTIQYVSSDKYVDTLENTNPTIEEWVSDIANADIVITNSFHGAVFSLIFNKPAICLARNKNIEGGGNSRINDLYKLLGITKYFTIKYNKDIAINILENNIDWNYINTYLANKKALGISFLTQNLK